MSDGCNSCQGGIPRAAGGGGQGFGATPPFFFMGQAMLNIAGSTAPEEVRALANLTLDQQGIFSQYVACFPAVAPGPAPLGGPLAMDCDITLTPIGNTGVRVELSFGPRPGTGTPPIAVTARAEADLRTGPREILKFTDDNVSSRQTRTVEIRDLRPDDTIVVRLDATGRDSSGSAPCGKTERITLGR